MKSTPGRKPLTQARTTTKTHSQLLSFYGLNIYKTSKQIIDILLSKNSSRKRKKYKVYRNGLQTSATNISAVKFEST